ncbi:putative ornithine decarboxylase [Aspergillus uvarum CBS 121591]|uniref:ornithine decarboxylase n=1 Tax=Aspergillus uvarum CBS 121591 TaxID=1448315 RepID=A0A319CEW6_9EURO|nr:putative ornithine decarboxylase [Aspergillus uvarum CBS 121591]PYH84396.1 putative ornithine decarboxylase [Aspergillus uvarum CBS 121591]
MVLLELPSAGKLIDHLIANRITQVNKDPHSTQSDRPFFIADTGPALKLYNRWRRALPNIAPFYAVKCNSDVRFLRFLADLGLGFDCASQTEIELVLSLGVDPSRIIFAHPCKSISAIRVAAARGISLTTFDNIDELDKVKAHAPNMHLLLRIYAQDDTAAAQLGNKFGAPLALAEPLLQRAKELGLCVRGVSFHVGSGARNPAAFTTAVHQARHVFDLAADLGLPPMDILDVGGGFQDTNFEEMAAPLARAIDAAFPDSSAVRVIAEPGRYFARTLYTMACKVISRRRQLQPLLDEFQPYPSITPDMLYLNDGVYGSFMLVLLENEVFVPDLAPLRGGDNGQLERRATGPHPYSIWGPTCDGIDCVAKEVVMEGEVKVGDWLVFREMGAYSVVSATQFNGFSNDYEVIYASDYLASVGGLGMTAAADTPGKVWKYLEWFLPGSIRGLWKQKT